MGGYCHVRALFPIHLVPIQSPIFSELLPVRLLCFYPITYLVIAFMSSCHRLLVIWSFRFSHLSHGPIHHGTPQS